MAVLSRIEFNVGNERTILHIQRIAKERSLTIQLADGFDMDEYTKMCSHKHAVVGLVGDFKRVDFRFFAPIDGSPDEPWVYPYARRMLNWYLADEQMRAERASFIGVSIDDTTKRGEKLFVRELVRYKKDFPNFFVVNNARFPDQFICLQHGLAQTVDINGLQYMLAANGLVPGGTVNQIQVPEGEYN